MPSSAKPDKGHWVDTAFGNVQVSVEGIPIQVTSADISPAPRGMGDIFHVRTMGVLDRNKLAASTPVAAVYAGPPASIKQKEVEVPPWVQELFERFEELTARVDDLAHNLEDKP